MLKIDLLDFLIISLFLFFLNIILKVNNLLIDRPDFGHHKIFSKKKIPLSGGLYFFFSLIYLYCKYNLSLQIVYLFSIFILIGLLSDRNIMTSAYLRLLLQFLLLLIIVITQDLNISSTRITYLDNFLTNKYFNYLFTIFCFLVLINGSNFIDGLNGLSSGYYLVLSVSVIFLKITDNIIILNENFFYYLPVILLIFLFLNIINKNFMGDNGIYFLSGLIGFYLIKFSNENFDYISPLYIVSILWYPAFENLFSIVRRLLKKKKVSNADKFHLHVLLYSKISRKYNSLISNNISSMLIIVFCIPGMILSNMHHNNSYAVCLIIFINIFIYLNIYFFLVRNEK
jgi:UDP-N-acetylmuramyl pentapeptide phosphotransferase/UDP-N-acetylglucosamine-1-phosphate transferase